MNTKQQKALALEAFKAAWQTKWPDATAHNINAETAFEMWWAGRQTRKATSAKRG